MRQHFGRWASFRTSQTGDAHTADGISLIQTLYRHVHVVHGILEVGVEEIRGF